MANVIQATVYQIDGNPLASPITVNFLTSELVIKEALLSTIPEVTSAIYYYNVVNNQQSVQTYYVGESIFLLNAFANNNGTSQTICTVFEINGDPQKSPFGVYYSFPSASILIGESINPQTGVNAYIQYKGVKYYTGDSQSDLYDRSKSIFPQNYTVGPGSPYPYSNITNSALGYQAFDSNINGGQNVAIGYNALTASTVTNNNVAVGYNTLAAHTAVGNGNSVAIGYNALSTKTGLSDSNNVAIGILAMSDSGGTGGQSNTAIGGQALRNNNGNRNVAVGYQSMRFNTTGAANIAVGYQGLYNTTGTQNIGVGYFAGLGITTGSYNVVIGGTSASSIATLSNNMIFADGQGNERFRVDNGARMGIGATSINPSAKVQIDSTSQGFLPPRMTGAQAEAISSPAEGLMVYATSAGSGAITSKGWWGYDGSTWVKFN